MLARRNSRVAKALALLFGILPGAVVFGVLVAFLGAAVAGGAALAVLVACSLAVWFGSMPMLLRLLEAKRCEEGDLPRVRNLLEGVCVVMGSSLPELRVVEVSWRNALMLSGPRRRDVFVVTRGLAEGLGRVMLEGVVAHELVHARRGESLRATIAAGVCLPVATVAPTTATRLAHALLGQGREMRCDLAAVLITRYPPGLRDALAGMVEGGWSPALGASRSSGRVEGGAGGLRNPSGAALAATSWLWTLPLDPPVEPEELIGELDAPDVRIGALGEL